MAPSGFLIVLDFPITLEKNTFIPIWDIITSTLYTVEISKDGSTYVGVKRSDITEYTFRYLRL